MRGDATERWRATGVFRATWPSFARLGWRLLSAIWLRLLAWQQRAHERHHLASLSDAALKDIGLSRSDVEREWRKPFWRP